LRAITLPLRNISVNARNLATYWSFSPANKQFRPVLAPENFPNPLPFFTEHSPYFFAEGFTLLSPPQLSLTLSLAPAHHSLSTTVRFCTFQRRNSQRACNSLSNAA
jgi:hypothetical protein